LCNSEDEAFYLVAAAELNKEAARAYAKLVGCAPMDMPSLIEVVGKKSSEAIETEDGRDRVMLLELAILEQLSSMIRCTVGCLGGGWGASARCSLTANLCATLTYLLICVSSVAVNLLPCLFLVCLASA
jgi:shikimate kinase